MRRPPTPLYRYAECGSPAYGVFSRTHDYKKKQSVAAYDLMIPPTLEGIHSMPRASLRWAIKYAEESECRLGGRVPLVVIRSVPAVVRDKRLDVTLQDELHYGEFVAWWSGITV